MRLLFIIPSITNYFTFLEDLIKELIEKGHDVHLAASRKHIARIDAYRREIQCEVHDIDFPRALDPMRHLAAARHVNELIQKIQPDLVNIHFSAALFTTMLGKKDNWPPCTGTIHGLGSPLIKGWRKLAISLAEKWSAERADEVFVLTEDDRAHLQKTAPKANVKVLGSFGMGCDLNRFNIETISADRKKEIRNEYGIEESDFVYIFIGRQTHFKGFDKVVRAFMQTKKESSHSKLILLGEKDRIHPTSRRQKFEKALKSDTDIVRVGWKENVQDFLAISHLNVFPSEREGLPVNLMESLAMGVPVITINSRGCREVVRHEVDGLVLEENSVEAIAKAMTALRENQEKLNEFSKNALSGRERFDRKYFLEDQFSIYERLTGKKV